MASILEETTSAEFRPRLPPELLMLILEHLPPDAETLRQTCLVSKQCLSISQPYLFRHIRLSAPKATTDHARSPCSILYQVLLNSPYIALYIRHLTILSASSLPRAAIPLDRMWISSDETLPALLNILVNAKLQSFRVRLSGESWQDLPLALHSSIRSLVNSPSLRDVDFTGFDVVDAAMFKQSRIQRLKFSEMGELHVETESDAVETCSSEFSSLTLLDMDIGAVISWAVSSQSFRALRDLRLAFHPLTDIPNVEELLRHIAGTLESLHFQPVYARWSPDNFFRIGELPVLTSLRLSLGISVQSNPVPWVIFILRNLGHNRLQNLTIDLRIDNREVVQSLPWAELNSALCGPPLVNLQALVITLFLYQPRPPGMRALWNRDEEGTIRWLAGEIPRLLPSVAARDVFEVHELQLSFSRFFYWPGPLAWSDSES
ncbi:hypothetical protein MSAN_00637300 [Mycena sanguinolenta]|uniref:F-box domain-containing protein n=1 Tax=Mycena sanguinolenta TaxID=230812 RepID=A0A8H6Z0R2_9AGAR|nr:hypothetical protein MSAN_00637300 [Mycena sanguinolenta]